MEEMVQRLKVAKIDHRDLDAAIEALSDRAVVDQLRVARLKRRKLQLRDEISWLEDTIEPDIIA